MHLSAKERTGKRHLLRSSVLRLAWSDIAHRRAVSLLTVVAIAIAIAISLLLNGYAYQIYRAQEAITNEEVPTIMTLACADVTDQKQRFTDDTLGNLRADPRISLAYPKIEIGVTLRNGDRTASVTGEGVLPDDPRIANGRLCWRHQQYAPGAEGLVLSLRLFEKMGGTIISGSANPERLAVSVSRTQDGKRQEDSVNLPIAGIMRHQAAECVLLPVDTAQRLDLFCSHKANTIGDEKPEMHFPSAMAYVPQQQLKRAQEDAKNLRIELQEAGGPFEYPDSKGPVWVAADVPADVLAAAMQWGSYHKHHILQMDVGGALRTVAALSADDPRWRESESSAPRTRTVYALNETAATSDKIVHDGKVCQVLKRHHQGHPFIAADYVCTEDTMRWLAFQPSTCALNKRMALVHTDSIATAALLQDTLDRTLRASPTNFAWGVYELTKATDIAVSDVAAADRRTRGATAISTSQQSDKLYSDAASPTRDQYSQEGSQLPSRDRVERSRLAALRDLMDSCRVRFPSLQVEEIPTAFAELDESRSGSLPPVVKIRFLSRTLFDKLTGGKPAAAGSKRHRSVDAIAVGGMDNWISHQLSISKISIKIVDHIRTSGEKKELWLSSDSRTMIKCYSVTSGLALFGDNWQEWLQAHSEKQEPSPKRTIAAGCPTHFGILLAGAADIWTQRLSKIQGVVRFADVSYVQSGTAQFGTVLSRQAVDEQIVKLLYPSLTILDTEHFTENVYQAADSQKLTRLPERETGTLVFASALSYLNAVKNTKDGSKLIPLEPLRFVRLVGFKVRDLSHPEGTVDDQLIATLTMTQPTFFKVEPQLTMTCRLAQREISLEGIDQTSVKQCRERLLWGRWPTKQDELLLPSALYVDSNNPKTTHQCIELTFIRGNTGSLTNRLQLPLSVVGVYQGDVTCPLLASDGLVRNVLQWERHQLIWNADAKHFDKPQQIYEQQGHVRATVVSRDVGALETLVREFERRGYSVTSALAQLRGLRQLARLLAGTTLAFSCGMLLIATFSIFVSGYSQIRTKTREVALYTSFGCETRDILRIFLYEGLIIGTAAFIVGAFSVLLMEPLFVRRIFVRILNINLNEIVQGMIAIPWQAFSLAFLISLLFVMAGVLLPASRACRTKAPGLELKKSE